MYFGSFQCSLLTMYSGSGMSRKAWGVMMSKTSPCTTAIATLVFLIFFVFPESSALNCKCIIFVSDLAYLSSYTEIKCWG
ncbi:hypothetical protein IW261DRAFT_1525366 [Armillaria novae-zelandiae]|uniref:Uncharacterized protein n=1 Tax=Armillaria novae-zelandiae TaxID=153914 RepID=A0AA39ND28_9AGAR|nr:hypothetical protein IW261DRAFT_1525366 [Armillaria novae-zelandiae]